MALFAEALGLEVQIQLSVQRSTAEQCKRTKGRCWVVLCPRTCCLEMWIRGSNCSSHALVQQQSPSTRRARECQAWDAAFCLSAHVSCNTPALMLCMHCSLRCDVTMQPFAMTVGLLGSMLVYVVVIMAVLLLLCRKSSPASPSS